MEIGFSLGSNMGDRAGYLSSARQLILDYSDTREMAASSLYETDPVDVQEAYREIYFINAVLVVDSEADGPAWLERLGTIEQKLGRVREADKNAPRTIDIDILYIGHQCIDSGGLVVPHPRWAQRGFVLKPLSEIRPDLVLPGYDQCVEELLQALDSDEKCAKLKKTW